MSWLALLAATRTFAPRVVGWVAGIDRRIWYALALVVGLGYFAHWNAERGRSEVEARVAKEVAEQVERIRASDAEALRAAERRAIEAERLADDRKETIVELEHRASTGPEAGAVCIPADIADGLRGL